MESRIAVLEARVGDIVAAGVIGSVAVLQSDVSRLRRDFADFRRDQEARAEAETDDRRAVKVALIGLTGVIGAALIAAIASLLVVVIK